MIMNSDERRAADCAAGPISRYEKMYHDKMMTPEEIASFVRSHGICACPSALGEPRAIVRAVAERALKEGLEGVSHHITFPQYPLPVYDREELKDRYHGVLWFVGAVARVAANEGRADIMPCYYKDIPNMWRTEIKPDIFYAAVSPMDRHGYFSFGLTGSESIAQMERADLRFLEVNSSIPRTMGSAFIHISQVDGLCESNEPVMTLPEGGEPDEISMSIGKFIAHEIKDGSTLQLGWGKVPDAVGISLMEKHNLGLHSELFTDSMVRLIECGAVTNSQKKINRYKSIAAFALGTRRMYDFMDDNPGMEIHSVEYVNDPSIISQNDKAISINSGLEIDFLGQVSAETLAGRPYSSTGGQVDFVRGAQLSKGGRSFIAMPSTAKGGEISRIKPALTAGSVVTTSKNDVDSIVTEYGIARLKGKTWSQRTRALINIAHPKFREQLLYEAKKLNIMI